MKRDTPRWPWYSLAALVLVGLLLASCARAKPSSAVRLATSASRAAASPPANAAPTPAPLVFRLAYPVGAQAETVPGGSFSTEVDNCASDEPLPMVQLQVAEVPDALAVDLAASGLDDSTYQAQVEQVVRETYDLDPRAAAQMAGALPVQVPGHHRAVIDARWNATWDQNVVQVVQEGSVVGEVPVRVFLGAEAEALDVRLSPCGEAVTPATAGPVVTTAPTASETSMAPEAPTPAEQPEVPGSAESITLVRDYIERITQGRYEEAYALLHPDYQADHPFDTWRQGYAAVTALDIRAVESVAVSPDTDEVTVGLTMTSQFRGQPSYSDWSATYRVVGTPGRPPYQRTIREIRMRRLGVG